MIAKALSLFAIICIAYSPAAIAAEQYADLNSDVAISVAKTKLDSGEVEYAYTVENFSAPDVVSVHIGYDYIEGLPQLREFPLGWQAEKASGAVYAPAGWEPTVITTEESPFHDLSWDVVDENNGIKPQTSLSDLTVVVKTEDPAYETSNWFVVVAGGNIRAGELAGAH